MTPHESPRPLTRRAFLPAGLAIGGLATGGLATHAAAQTPPAPLNTAPVSQIHASPRLTLHAIDTHHGSPGAAMPFTLSRLEDGAWRMLRNLETNQGGRTDEPLLTGASYVAGSYELVLHVDRYFAARGTSLPTPNFLAQVPVRFCIVDPAERIHLAILFTPWGYSYYRGS